MRFGAEEVGESSGLLNIYFNDFKELKYSEGIVLPNMVHEGQRLIMKLIQKSQTKWQ